MGFKTIISSLTVFQSLFLLFVTFNTLGNIFDGQEAVISSFTIIFSNALFSRKKSRITKKINLLMPMRFPASCLLCH